MTKNKDADHQHLTGLIHISSSYRFKNLFNRYLSHAPQIFALSFEAGRTLKRGADDYIVSAVRPSPCRICGAEDGDDRDTAGSGDMHGT